MVRTRRPTTKNDLYGSSRVKKLIGKGNGKFSSDYPVRLYHTMLAKDAD